MIKVKFLIYAIFLTSISIPSYAEETNQLTKPSEESPKNDSNESVAEKAGQVIKDTTDQVSKTLEETKVLREKTNYFGYFNYSPIDLVIPSKYGFSFGYNSNVDNSWEAEYLKGSVSVPFIIEDLGKMTDTRISIIGRSYFGGNSFNFSYGLSYFDFSLVLGDKLLNRVSGGGYPAIDLVEIQSLGFNLAVGNRWIFNRNISFGVDWISWAQPVYNLKRKSAFLDYATNQQDKDDVDKAMKLISYFPRLAAFKLQLGIFF